MDSQRIDGTSNFIAATINTWVSITVLLTALWPGGSWMVWMS